MSTAPIPLTSLVLNGQDAKRHYADLIAAVTSLSMTETITGASTVTVSLLDPKRQILQSAALTARSTVVLDRAAFELVKVSKQGKTTTATFEGLNVARLRRHDSYRKAAPGTRTRAQFVRDLIGEEPDVKVVTGGAADRALVELARGSGAVSGREAQKEDTWTAAGRVLGEIGWRCYEYRGVIYLASDAWLIAHNGRPYKLSPTSRGVDDIDFDWDTGKPAASATLYLRAGAHAIAPGTPLDLSGLGAGNGAWLVESIERTPFDELVTVQACRVQPTLPEPKDVAPAGAGNAGVTAWNGDYTDGIGGDGGAVIERITHLPDSDILHTEGTRSSAAEQFVTLALAQRGKRYVYGATGPNSWDCAGFVFDMARRACGVRFPNPVSAQAAACRRAGTTLTVAQAAYTRGALLWRQRGGGMGDHIVISLGNGNETIEAMGSMYGVVRGKIKGRGWTGAGWVPGIPVTAPALRDLRPG